ncbi:MAG: hypothetical protein AAGI67_10540, partial [Pseudomonadota bacterium]
GLPSGAHHKAWSGVASLGQGTTLAGGSRLTPGPCGHALKYNELFKQDTKLTMEPSMNARLEPRTDTISTQRRVLSAQGSQDPPTGLPSQGWRRPYASDMGIPLAVLQPAATMGSDAIQHPVPSTKQPGL